MQFPSRDLTNQFISLSYQDVVQRYTPAGTASYFLDGLGNVITYLPISSIGFQLLTVDQLAISASYSQTASYAMNGGGGGGTAGSASWASSSVSSSYSFFSEFCDTSSYAFVSLFSDTASIAIFSTYSDTSSFASLALNSDFALLAGDAITATSASYSQTASYALNGGGGGGGMAGSSSWASSSITSATASSLIGFNFTNTSSNVNVLSSDVSVVVISTGSYNAAFFDYVAKSGSNCRAGIVFGSWVNGLINYTEVSNIDVGDTSKVTMSLALNGGNIQLLANVTDTTPWNIKAMGRYL